MSNPNQQDRSSVELLGVLVNKFCGELVEGKMGDVTELPSAKHIRSYESCVVFEYLDSLERESRIRQLARTIEEIDDVRSAIGQFIEKRDKKSAGVLAMAYGPSMASFPDVRVRALALRASQLSPDLQGMGVTEEALHKFTSIIGEARALYVEIMTREETKAEGRKLALGIETVNEAT